jgi:hypothetical protein
MVDAVDEDTLAALQALWLTSPSLPALLDRAPASGAAKSTRDQPLKLPYGLLTCEPSPKTVRYIKSIRKDVRRCVLSIWGTHAQAKDALSAVLAIFHARLGAPNYPVITYPSGAKFVKLWPLNDGHLAKEEGASGARAGEDVWRATIEIEVTSVRQEAP